MTTTKKKTQAKSSDGKDRDAFHDEEERDALDRRLGLEVRRVRQERKLSLKDVAEATDYSVSYLSDCERGARSFTKAAIVEISKMLRVRIDDLLHAAGACERCGGSGVEPSAAEG